MVLFVVDTQKAIVNNKLYQFDLFVSNTVSARPFCHPEGNIFCHAGTGSVKGQALCFVRMPTF